MAQVVSPGKVKLSNGQLVNAAQGGWYDGQQYWGGTLSAPGQINSQSNQIGAGQMVSAEVNAQSAAQQGVSPQQFEQYLANQRKAVGAPATSPSAIQTVDAPIQVSSAPAAGAGAGIGYVAPGAPDLAALYKTMTESAGITGIEQKLFEKADAYAKAQSKINDNPYLSDADRVGRIQKLSTDYQNDVKNDQDMLAMKKADVETQLNIQTKQFDINSQVARDSLDRFNMLLQTGALQNANGDDIANLTRSTGLSSAAILSAVNAQKQKDVQTSVVSYDDGTNQGFAVINTQTGEIINRQTVAASKPSSSGGSGEPGSAKSLSNALAEMTGKISTKLNSYGHIHPDDWKTALLAWQSAGFKKDDFINNFGIYADPNRGDFSEKYGFANPTE